MDGSDETVPEPTRGDPQTAFYAGGVALARSRGAADAVPFLLEQAARAAGALAGLVSTIEGPRQVLRIRSAYGGSVQNGARAEPLARALLGAIAQAGGVLVIGDLGRRRELEPPGWLAARGARSLLAVPLRDPAGALLGVLGLYGRAEDQFGAEQVRTAELFAAQLSLVADNEALRTRLRADVREEVRLLASLLHERDPLTGEHSARVMKYARLLAQGLGLSREDTDRVAYAGLLHDLGKIAVGDAVLHKPETLSGSEWRTIQCHPEVGARLLERSRLLRELAPIVRYNHARYAGGGYPDPGLRGAEIPLGSRILAVADAYEAMVSTRPYRRALPERVAIEELKRCAGTQFDPQIVTVFLKIIQT